MTVSITLIHGTDPQWSTHLSDIYQRIDPENDTTLFPLHFTQVVLPKIGGKLAQVAIDNQLVGFGLLFPRKTAVGPAALGGASVGTSHLYTLRLHPLADAGMIAELASYGQQIIADINAELDTESRVIHHTIGSRNSYRQTVQPVGSLDNKPVSLGQPNRQEAEAIRRLHQQIWRGGPETLYPVDIHSREFGLATDLVVRVGDEVVGFLMGFYKNSGSTLPEDWNERFHGEQRIESQVMGILPEFRGQRFGYLLKRAQGELAHGAGINIVNWTADPLQFPNAVLNFGRLGAVAFDFYNDLYPFRNELNRVPASRFGLTWLVSTERVRSRPLDFHEPVIIDVGASNIPKINNEYQLVIREPNESRIAIEIPAQWTAIQSEDMELALAWRSALDQIFEETIGLEEGQYTVTGVGQDGEKCYLVAERSEEALWTKLSK